MDHSDSYNATLERDHQASSNKQLTCSPIPLSLWYHRHHNTNLALDPPKKNWEGNNAIQRNVRLGIQHERENNKQMKVPGGAHSENMIGHATEIIYLQRAKQHVS